MKNIEQIYENYKIMKNLAQHQLRVAAVAKLICDNCNIGVTTDDVVKACLVHDMGNILKFDLLKFPEFLEPEGLEYWENVREELKEHYNTNDEHVATVEIAREIGVSQSVMECLSSIGFSKTTQAVNDSNFNHKICNYVDQRVAPYGVVSIEGRMEDGRKRYANSARASVNALNFEVIANDLKTLENQIFEHIRIKPEDITDEAIKPITEELKNYSL